MKKKFFSVSILVLSVLLILSACTNNVSKKGEKEATALGEPLKGSKPLADETKEMEKQYKKAVAEMKKTKGKLIVWAGGDAPNQQAALQKAFEERFPEVPIEIKVDLSKFHDEKINEELSQNKLTPDVTMLQTTNDFDDWKKQGVLEAYKPVGFKAQKENYADPDGYFITAKIFSFLPEYAASVKIVPHSYQDFLSEEYKNHLVLTPPHDDDAVLYVYDKIINKYGEEFLDKLKAQNPTFKRGTAAPAALVGTDDYLGNLVGYAQPAGGKAVSFVPTEDPFITWTQRAAMFKQTKHKEAAKLFLSYVSSKEYQSVDEIWPTRKDLNVISPYKELADYQNTDPQEFIRFMRDRAHIEELKKLMEEKFGKVTGASPLTDPALLKATGN